MPIRLNTDDYAFAVRVHGYCLNGVSEPDMAEAEAMSLTSFRNRLFRCGLSVHKQTARTLVRTGSWETFAELIDAGQIVAADEPAGAVPA